MQTNKHNPIFLTFATSQVADELGQFSFVINKGMVNQKGEGFLVETNIGAKMNFNQNTDVSLWLKNAHEFLSNIFKEMTKGNMYNSFLN